MPIMPENLKDEYKALQPTIHFVDELPIPSQAQHNHCYIVKPKRPIKIVYFLFETDPESLIESLSCINGIIANPEYFDQDRDNKYADDYLLY